MVKAVRIHAYGGPDVLVYEDVAHDVDGVLDLIGGEVQARSLTVLKPGCVLVTTAGQPDAAAAEALGVRAVGVMTRADPAQLTQIARLIDAGAVKPVVSHVFPLAATRQAHELADLGHARGKIVLRVVLPRPPVTRPGWPGGDRRGERRRLSQG
jgi:NADPH:quinone reductase-like Zn-dependent oxidoreductase